MTDMLLRKKELLEEYKDLTVKQITLDLEEQENLLWGLFDKKDELLTAIATLNQEANNEAILKLGEEIRSLEESLQAKLERVKDEAKVNLLKLNQNKAKNDIYTSSKGQYGGAFLDQKK